MGEKPAARKNLLDFDYDNIQKAKTDKTYHNGIVNNAYVHSVNSLIK